jgi:hypothetical protein
MKWFGMKGAAMEAGRPVLARAWGSGAVALGEWPASYEAQLRAGVIGNPVAQRAMRLVSEGAGACVLKVGGVDAGMDGEATARIGALVARASAGQGLIETLASHVLLHGNGYVQVIAGVDGMPAELFALRPERVSVEADARGWVRAVRPGDRLAVEYQAGMAADLNGVAEPLRQGIMRLAAEHFVARGDEGAAPPAVVSALWRPWRRMRLS